MVGAIWNKCVGPVALLFQLNSLVSDNIFFALFYCLLLLLLLLLLQLLLLFTINGGWKQMLDSILLLAGLESECENSFYSPVDVCPPNSMTDKHIRRMTAGTKSWRRYRYSSGWMSVPPLPQRMISWLGSSTQPFRPFNFLLAHCFGFAAYSSDVLIQSHCSHTVVFSSCFTRSLHISQSLSLTFPSGAGEVQSREWNTVIIGLKFTRLP